MNIYERYIKCRRTNLSRYILIYEHYMKYIASECVLLDTLTPTHTHYHIIHVLLIDHQTVFYEYLIFIITPYIIYIYNHHFIFILLRFLIFITIIIMGSMMILMWPYHIKCIFNKMFNGFINCEW